MSRLENESGPVEWAEMHPDNFPSREFARRVLKRNGRPLPDLGATCLVRVKCSTPHCRGMAASNDCGSSGPLFCDDCWEQHYIVSAPRELFPWWSVVVYPVILGLAVIALCVGAFLALVEVVS